MAASLWRVQMLVSLMLLFEVNGRPIQTLATMRGTHFWEEVQCIAFSIDSNSLNELVHVRKDIPGYS